MSPHRHLCNSDLWMYCKTGHGRYSTEYCPVVTFCPATDSCSKYRAHALRPALPCLPMSALIPARCQWTAATPRVCRIANSPFRSFVSGKKRRQGDFGPLAAVCQARYWEALRGAYMRASVLPLPTDTVIPATTGESASRRPLSSGG